jgi:hypothetical protein
VRKQCVWPTCDVVFEAKMRSARFCSPRCRQRAHRDPSAVTDKFKPDAPARPGPAAIAARSAASAILSEDGLAGKDLELQRLEALTTAAQHVLADASDEGDRPLILAAVDRLLKVSQRRAAMLGLDGAKKDDGKPAVVSPLEAARARRDAKSGPG